MTLIASILISAIYFAIAEVVYKKATGHYFDFGYGVQNKESLIMTFIVVALALSTGPLIVSFIFSQLK